MEKDDTAMRIKLICNATSPIALTLMIVAVVAALALLITAAIVAGVNDTDAFVAFCLKKVVPALSAAAGMLGTYLVIKLIKYITVCHQRAEVLKKQEQNKHLINQTL